MNADALRALIRTKEASSRISGFLDDPIVVEFLDSLEKQQTELVLTHPVSDAREQARLTVQVLRRLRQHLNLALQRGEVAKTELVNLGTRHEH